MTEAVNLTDEAVAAALPTVPTPTPVSNMAWYVVHAYSGMEKAVERNIMERVNRAGMNSRTVKRKRLSVAFTRVMCWSKWSWMMKLGTW